jgi:molybdopterin converting factor small subunit
MKIAVKYQTQIKRAAGLAGESVELGGDGSLRQLLLELAARRGEAFRHLVLREDGMPQDAILVFVGDRQVTTSAAVALREGDVVTLLAPMAGG